MVQDDKEVHNDENMLISMVFHKPHHMSAELTTNDWLDSLLFYRNTYSFEESKYKRINYSR